MKLTPRVKEETSNEPTSPTEPVNESTEPPVGDPEKEVPELSKKENAPNVEKKTSYAKSEGDPAVADIGNLDDTVVVWIEQVYFDPNGDRVSVPSRQPFNIRDWSIFIRNHEALGWSVVEIVHIPDGVAVPNVHPKGRAK